MTTLLTLSAADRYRRTRLRRAKSGATVLLAIAAAVFLAVLPAAQSGQTWAGYLLAASEAAMIGGLADWFAVTALFRRPLGLPIPHTAIIPTRKNALGASLGDFVGENFLSPAVVRRRLVQADVVGRVGAWLARPVNAERVAAELANLLKGALEVLRDEDVLAVAEGAVRTRLRDADVAPTLGRLLEQVVADGAHRPLVDVVARRTAAWLHDNPDTVVTVIQAQAPEWSPAFVDRALARRVYAELVRISAAAADDPDHALRRTLDGYLARLAQDLQHDPDTAQRLRTLTSRIADHPATRDAVATMVAGVRKAVVALIEEPDGELRRKGADAVREVGGRLVSDTALRAKVQGWLGAVVEHVVMNYREEITRTITDTIDRWDGAEASRRIELAAGRDLQFIRVNGTVVGALAGLAIHAVAQLLG